MKGYQIKRVLALSSVSLLTLLVNTAHASGYNIVFQSVATLADSGDAAVINDASTNWYNSAGLVSLPQQSVFGGFEVYAPVRFTGTTTAPNLSGFSFSGTSTVSSHTNKLLPLFHYTVPFYQRYAFGISMVPAWGLAENYGGVATTRYDLIRIDTRSIDLAPSLAMKVNEHFSFGIGADAHYFTLQQQAAARLQYLSAAQPDSMSRSIGQDWAYGGHLGLLYRFNEHTRIGFNYRSKIVHELQGYSHLSFYGGNALPGGQSEFETNQFSLNIVMPPTSTLSVYHDINDKIAIMGTIKYDQWATASNILAKNYQSITTTGASNLLTVPLPKKYSNTFDFGIGGHYQYSDKLVFRGSIRYEDTPTNDAYRDIDFPDGEKLGINLGIGYKYDCHFSMNADYGHVFVRSKSINTISSVTGVTNVGTTQAAGDFIGAEMVWNI